MVALLEVKSVFFNLLLINEILVNDDRIFAKYHTRVCTQPLKYYSMQSVEVIFYLF